MTRHAFLLASLLAAGDLQADSLTSFDPAFLHPAARATVESRRTSRNGPLTCHRVLLGLPELTLDDWRAYRQSIRSRIEQVLRVEGYHEIGGRSVEIDPYSSVISIIGVRPSALAERRVRAKRIHVLATRAANGNCFISYEVRAP